MVKKMTIDDLARLIQENVASKEDIATVALRLDSLEGRVDALDGRLDAMDSKLVAIHQEVKDLKRDTAEITELRVRVARVEDKLGLH